MAKNHGGLTRSGKVRNQTKKVEKVETLRKKKPSGRAHVRQLYQEREWLHGDEIIVNRKHRFNPQN